ncbi:MAG TPA: bifunctional nuclease family protein [Gemmatimonadaceae bacterium]|jgi:bifunctional DNase/RNase|nr:bifunctional nuclease family protein [Gemmatimonadaceae bacterium]
MIEVLVSRLGLDSATGSYVVVLQERGGTRLLPIWIGQPEAESIVRHMHNVKGPRPFTHDLVRSLIVGMGAQLRRVHITRVEKSTYFAELQIQRAETLVHIDARPSDSIAIALRLSAPIFVADELLVEPDDEEEERETPGVESSGDVPGGEEVAESELNADQLKIYLENLRPEDFGKFNP